MSDDEVYSSDDILAMLSPEARAALAAVQSKDNSRSLEPDFGLSQFWYTDEFSDLMAQEAITMGGLRISDSQRVRIACVACPSAYQGILRAENRTNVEAYVFEYDQRFSVYGTDFVHYDLYSPLAIPPAVCGTFDFVIVDPPYLNPDCLQHLKRTVDILVRTPYNLPATDNAAKEDKKLTPSSSQSSRKSQIAALEAIMFADPSQTPSQPAYPQSRVIVNTGAILHDELLKNWQLKIMTKTPAHRTPLMNEFFCYTSYESALLGGKRIEE